jgi:flavin reductase (DIM6/NTAB) family NADH-FMN oxidoreductase RutF
MKVLPQTTTRADDPDDQFDAQRFRETLGCYASGVAVITGVSMGEPVGFTCQSFYSVSLDPPLVSFSVMRTSTTFPRIRSTGDLGVSVLADHQRNVSDQFGRSGGDKWSGIDWFHSKHGNPVIAGALMWLDCSIWAEHEAGDHSVVIARVNGSGHSPRPAPRPLLFYRGRYHARSDRASYCTAR